MTSIASPHDKVFKSAMKDLTVARSFLQTALPAELKQKLRWETLTLRPGTFVSKELQAFYTDVLYSAEIEGQEIFLYLLVEAQSKPEELMPFRLLEYMTKIWRYYLDQLPGKSKQQKSSARIPVGTQLPLIYPLIYYTGQRTPYPFSTRLFDCFAQPELAEKYLLQPFALLDLNQLSDEEIKQYQLATCLMLFQKHIRDKDLRPTLEIVINKKEWIKTVEHGGEYYEILLNYVATSGEISGDPEELFEKLGASAPTAKRMHIMTIAEMLKQKGKLEGVKKVARNLLRSGFDSKIVAKNTGLLLSEIEEIQASLKKTKKSKSA